VVTDRSRAPCTFPLRLLIILPTNISIQLLRVSRSARISQPMFPLMHPTHVTRLPLSAHEDEIRKSATYLEQPAILHAPNDGQLYKTGTSSSDNVLALAW
jgi:hypothetical protein